MARPALKNDRRGHRAWRRRTDTRRTTLTLPRWLLQQAEQLARERRQTVSAVIAGFLEEGLRDRARAPQRLAQMLEMWKTAIVPASEEERLLLEGVVLEDPSAGER